MPLDENRFRSRGGLKVLVTDAAEIVEAEPNDQPAQATPLAAPGVAGGTNLAARTTRPARRHDLFRFESRKGQTWIIEIEAARRRSPLDSKIEVLDAQGRPDRARCCCKRCAIRTSSSGPSIRSRPAAA